MAKWEKVVLTTLFILFSTAGIGIWWGWQMLSCDNDTSPAVLSPKDRHRAWVVETACDYGIGVGGVSYQVYVQASSLSAVYSVVSIEDIRPIIAWRSESALEINIPEPAKILSSRQGVGSIMVHPRSSAFIDRQALNDHIAYLRKYLGIVGTQAGTDALSEKLDKAESLSKWLQTDEVQQRGEVK